MKATFLITTIGGGIFAIDGEDDGGMMRIVGLEIGAQLLDDGGAIAFALLGLVDEEGSETEFVGVCKIILLGIVEIDVEKTDELGFFFYDVIVIVRGNVDEEILDSANITLLGGENAELFELWPIG